MHVAHCRCGIEFDHVVTIGNAVDRIFGRRIKAERFGRKVAVNRKIRAGERRGSQGTASHALIEVAKTREIALKHPEERHHPVREENRLARLHVREARHDHVGIGARHRDALCLQSTDGRLDLTDHMTQIHLRRGRRLVIAAAAGVEPPARRADNFGHALFDRHMDVFVLDGEDKLARADFFGDLVKSAADGLRIRFGNNALTRKHRGMRLRILDVKRAHTLLERNRRIELFNQFVGRQVKTTAAALALLAAHESLSILVVVSLMSSSTTSSS